MCVRHTSVAAALDKKISSKALALFCLGEVAACVPRPAECKNKEQVLVRTCITSAYCFVACVRVYSAAYVLLSTAQRSKAAAVVSLARRGRSGQKNASPRLRFWAFGVGDGAVDKICAHARAEAFVPWPT
jgi:hypothetical protein